MFEYRALDPDPDGHGYAMKMPRGDLRFASMDEALWELQREGWRVAFATRGVVGWHFLMAWGAEGDHGR